MPQCVNLPWGARPKPAAQCCFCDLGRAKSPLDWAISPCSKPHHVAKL